MKFQTYQPQPDEIERASKDVAWEYVAFLGAAYEMARGLGPPSNHIAQDAFLVHTRTLAEFFRGGISEFQRTGKPPTRRDNTIFAVDFCESVGWQPAPFGSRTKLVIAINQSLSHPSYSRHSSATGHLTFDGSLHVHGTVVLISRAWENFLKVVRPEFLSPTLSEDIPFWLVEHTKNWRVISYELLNINKFEEAARQWNWKFNETPDGAV